jgi:hypothetical protein
MSITELDFTADDWFEIAGRGHVATFSDATAAGLPEKMHPRELLNRYVRIDGNEYYVTGVELQGYNRDKFGLCIRGPRK